MKSAGMKRAVSLIMLMLLIGSIGAYADHSITDQLSFEVKFLLSPDKVLTENHVLTETVARQFSLETEYTPIDVIYLETTDRAFISEDWVNRIRWKEGKQKPERTCKKRYPVAGNDPASILSALGNAVADGIDLRSDSCSLQIDWGYSKMTLSITWESSGRFKDYQSLEQFSTEDAISYFAEFMPADEIDWNRPGWGKENLARAQKVGIISYKRIKGSWEGTEVTFDITSIPLNDAAEDMVELSFKADNYSDAAEIRQQLIGLLEEEGLLLEGDSLKTQKILDVWRLFGPA